MTDSTTADRRARATVGCPFCLTLNRVLLARAGDRPRCGECGKPLLLDRPQPVHGDQLDRVLEGTDAPLLVDFYADWCGPCKTMAPVLDDFAREHAGEAVVLKLDTDRNPEAASRFGIRGIPTLILFRDGREVARRTGAVPAAELEELLDAGASA